MQISLENTGSLERKMTVEVPVEKINSAIEQKLQNMSRQVKISGFRPGKVPMRVVRQRFGKQVSQEVLADTMKSSYQEAIIKEKLRPAGSPQIEQLNLEMDQDLKYVATFEVYPEIHLADLNKLEIEVADVEIMSSDTDAMIEKLRKQKMNWKEVDRDSKIDDQVKIDFKGTIDNEEFAGGSQDDFKFVLGNSTLLPDFEKQLNGVKKGQEKTFDVTFPDNYMQQELAGKVATFAIKVKSVEEGELPELNEELVKEFGVEDGSLDSLIEQLNTNMSLELAQRKKAFDKDQVMNQLYNANEFEIPSAMVTEEIKVLRTHNMRDRNIQDESQLPDSLFEDEARRRISLGLMIGEIASQNNIKLDQDKVNEHLSMLASGYSKPEEVIQYYRNNQQAMANIEILVMEEQVVEFVLHQARQIKKAFTYDEFISNQT